ncbi:MAG: hypothetical protein M1496_01690 [Candidatus Thermoplasmatota archaeon]|jgi:hypothetical protein|nr:hypothetical protein [Candidatus Thermoplasmatota archaeon]
MGIVRRIGRKRAIVVIVRIPAELIYTVLKNNGEFMEKTDSLMQKNMKSVSKVS